ncbi:MAG: pyridoxamine 5'-phosphate oxidase family protein [Candidatus Helarchaeota archaeon]|nr:pyridoxamine 5'-phosphate oxidase family protein [Candidatus Helarchaeota archaeon]
MTDQMPEEELKKELRLFFKKRQELVLCTCSNNIPRATPMDFYTDGETFDLYVGMAPGRKITNIEANPVVSIGIYTPMKEGKIQGLQVTAVGKDRLIFLKSGDPEFEKAQKIVRGKRKLILRIRPTRLELMDYDFAKRGYAKMQSLDL